ncbi:hypothetical protein NA78x_003155 [Anatilimnocola sp. NA78]|uniref:hypothetical protein n=1 Tax=Anatilimnocola sp. NA78 TaxID=3415683 RepID=UPI003CE4715D
MKSFYAQSLAWTLGLAWFANTAHAQYLNQPSLLPIPSAMQSYPVSPVAAYNDQAPMADNLPSPSDAPSILPAPPMAQPDHSLLSDEYKKATTSGWGDKDVVYEDGANSACGAAGCTPCQNYWYGYAGGLIMTRNKGDHMLLTEDTVTGDRILCSCGGDMDWTGGFETTIGRTFNCGNNGIEVTYWGLFPQDRWMDAYSTTGSLGTPLDFSTIDYDDGVISGPASDWFNAAYHHQVIIYEDIQNIEVNLLGQCYGNGFIGGGPMATCTGAGCNGGMCGPSCAPRWGCGWMMGVRYFQFDNGLHFNADATDDTFDGDLDELCYHIRMQNRLIGFQVGGGFNWNVLDCFQVYGLAKAGIFNNNINQDQSFHGNNGNGVFNAGDWTGDEFHINNSKNQLSMIGQLDLGARYQINCHFSVKAGYRAMVAAGVAQWEHQIPADFSDAYYLNRIESNGSLLLHGAYVGGEFRF